MRKLWRVGVGALGSLVALACGGGVDVVQHDKGKGGEGAEGGEGAVSGTSGTAGTIINGGTAGDATGGKGGASGKGGQGGTSSDPCDGVRCDRGMHCDNGTCRDNEDCTDDLDCTEAKYCKDGVCTDDDCVPDTRSCDGNNVVTCNSNGSANPGVRCRSGGYFTSTCVDTGSGDAGCGCEDDWDCPAFMVCDVNVCTGTGVAPTCTLPPTPFTDVLPQLEFRWGGTNHEYDNNGNGNDNTGGNDNPNDDADDDATGKPFAWSAQVVSLPLVINLDDDNGDGKADERDFPEILFISHNETQRDSDGIVRAVHGGGPAKGEDFFALCGNPARPAMSMSSYTDANGAYWSEGAAVMTDCATDGNAESRGDGLARSSSALAAGDIDGDGYPEIVVALENKGFMILNNRGEPVFVSPANIIEPATPFFVSPAPAIVNVDLTGLPEIVVGPRVISLTQTNGVFAIDKIYVGAAARGTQDQNNFINGPMVCVADLTADPGLEIVAGPTAYKLPAAPPMGCGTAAMPCPLDVVWDARPSLAAAQAEGLCAVADVLPACTSVADCAAKPPGPVNALDGKPEVVLVANGHLVILDGAAGTLLRDEDLGGGVAGGAPNIDDFDGDGYPEIATALSNFYDVIDLQAPSAACPAWPNLLDPTNDPPQTNPARDPGGISCRRNSDCTVAGTTCNELSGACVCLHNGWRRDTEDDSSSVTSSSVFDFNGDGAAEVVYGDECYFKVYDGSNGGVYLAIPSVSRTIVENPVVADVDNDGNAEIVFVQNNWVEQCDEGDTNTNGDWDTGETLRDWPTGTRAKDSLPNGITVLGDPTDTWVAARRVWNEHAYHVTNVLEGGGIPAHEPESWLDLNGRFYNTYRSQPRNYGVAPDLVLPAIQISSPDAACGELSDTIQITVLVKNQGDLRVGPGVVLQFFGTWGRDEEALLDVNGDPIAVTLTKSLEPGASTLVTVEYQVGWNAAPNDASLPDSVHVVIDGDELERECREDNNEAEADVGSTGEMLADLAVSVDTANCNGSVTITVENTGSAPASDIVVEIYAGDPSSGGTLLGEVTIDGPLAPGDSETVTTDVLSSGRFPTDVTIWVVADPNDAITECNDANNVAEGPMLDCQDDPH